MKAGVSMMDGAPESALSISKYSSENGAGDVKFNDDNSSDLSYVSPSITHRPTDDDSEAPDAPEVIVRRENTAVSVARFIVVAILVAAAVGTSVFAYFYSRNSEQSAYEAAFNGVGGRIIESFLDDTLLNVGMASTISSSLSIALSSANQAASNFTVSPQEKWDALTANAIFVAAVRVISWGPILRGDDERRSFETFAQTQSLETGANPPCLMCGNNPARGFLNPAALVEFPGFGTASCGETESAGRLGSITPDQCPVVITLVSDICECGDFKPEDVPSTIVHIPDRLVQTDSSGSSVIDVPYGRELYHPYWQVSGIGIRSFPAMYDHYAEEIRARALDLMLETKTAVLSHTFRRSGLLYENYTGTTDELGTILFFPVFDVGEDKDSIVAAVGMELSWSNFITGVFPILAKYADVVIENDCTGNAYTFKVDSDKENLIEVGPGDLHDPAYDDQVFRSTGADFLNLTTVFDGHRDTDELCAYTFAVYSTKEFEAQYISNEPWIFASVTAAIFIFSASVFWVYDMIVRQRQRKVMASAIRTSNLVSSLFPENVRQRLFQNREEAGDEYYASSQSKMQTFLDTSDDKPTAFKSAPIADLFPHATVMMLDIAGFTCWASERTPSDVFTLLERMYGEFDMIAKRMGVFKVETIGDSYVAVCGLPKPRANHAVVMARFAKTCLRRIVHLTEELEMSLGPSTADLRARIGLHSGPVTAGVLRGEKARFQLFGDTVNTASRIEASGIPHRIHASKETADLLIASGREDWVRNRDETVVLKGKGEFQTFWIEPRSGNTQSVAESASTGDINGDIAQQRLDNTKQERLVDWNTEVLYRLLQKVVSDRGDILDSSSKTMMRETEAKIESPPLGQLVIDEMTQVLELPKRVKVISNAPEEVDLGVNVKNQLRDFIQQIANLYRDVPFHNFEHCSHVIMSASKLMKRIVDPEGIDHTKAKEEVASDIHCATYGMSSDPMMAFAIVFSALIHDVDHLGVTNQELCQMGIHTVEYYRQKSVAEQNSIDVAWSVLMNDSFRGLRSCIYSSEYELRRFRQLVVNAVMATDIADKELKVIREMRWDTAFSDLRARQEEAYDMDRKATIVFEYIIQASDIAHTMQHWHTYQKFNKRLFEERYLAFKNGHCDKDPSIGWYGGELWFFDNYIIPLANKLKDCGVFGVSHFELLTYASQNRSEWVVKGKEIVADMLSECQKRYPTDGELKCVGIEATTEAENEDGITDVPSTSTTKQEGHIVEHALPTDDMSDISSTAAASLRVESFPLTSSLKKESTSSDFTNSTPATYARFRNLYPDEFHA